MAYTTIPAIAMKELPNRRTRRLLPGLHQKYRKGIALRAEGSFRSLLIKSTYYHNYYTCSATQSGSYSPTAHDAIYFSLVSIPNIRAHSAPSFILYTYISSRLSPTEISNNQSPSQATLLTNLLGLLHFHLLPSHSHLCPFIVGTFNLTFFTSLIWLKHTWSTFPHVPKHIRSITCCHKSINIQASPSLPRHYYPFYYIITTLFGILSLRLIPHLFKVSFLQHSFYFHTLFASLNTHYHMYIKAGTTISSKL